MAPAFTRLFEEGEINVLIGTTALLGEGWDAPAMNTLILATVIGAYVTSNQLRGRAIRVDPKRPWKTSNIWHLACLDPEAIGRDEAAGAFGLGGSPEGRWDDLALLRRRFLTFVGPAFDAPEIRNGFGRLGLDWGQGEKRNPGEMNALICRRAEDRDGLATQWREALEVASHRMQRQIREILLPRAMVASHSIVEHFLRFDNAVTRWIKTQMLINRMRRIAQVLLDSLRETGLIVTPPEKLRLEIFAGAQAMRVALTGARGREEAMYIESLKEIFNPLSSPRYLLLARRQVYCVPSALAARKETATAFFDRWRKRVGRARMIYTHTPEGRLALLRAKERFLAARHRDAPQIRVAWR